MSAGKKPVREWDTILVRVPDGLKDIIAERARVNGRSLGSEAAAMIEEALHRPDEVGVIKLSAEVIRMQHEVENAKAILQYSEEQLQMMKQQLRAKVPSLDEGVDLTDYAARVYLSAKHSINRDKIIKSNQLMDKLIEDNPDLNDGQILELIARLPKDDDVPSKE